MNNYYLAKEAEKKSDWDRAAYYWRLHGSKEDEEACMLLSESREIMDRYREKKKEISNDFVEGFISREEHEEYSDDAWREANEESKKMWEKIIKK